MLTEVELPNFHTKIFLTQHFRNMWFIGKKKKRERDKEKKSLHCWICHLLMFNSAQHMDGNTSKYEYTSVRPEIQWKILSKLW